MQFLLPQGEIDLISIKSRQFLQFFHFCNFCQPKGKIEANNWILVQNMQLLPPFGPRFDGIVVFKPITVTSGTRLYLDGKRNLYMSLVS